jgi:hypothetical protein
VYTDTDNNKLIRYGLRYQQNQDDLIRAISYLNKNSITSHNITAITDEDVFPHKDYLKQFNNAKIIKSGYIHPIGSPFLTVTKLNAASLKGLENIPDEEWICYGYISDLVAGKDWDKYIMEAIHQHGDNNVYVPMFTEIRDGIANRSVAGIKPTPSLIWDEWRRTICCHALTMPVPRREQNDNIGFFTEEDMNNYIEISNSANKPPVIFENPGDRVYGYYAPLILKAKHARKALRLFGNGFDLDFDNRLFTECKLKKAVVTRSFVFHPFCPFKEDSIGDSIEHN